MPNVDTTELVESIRAQVIVVRDANDLESIYRESAKLTDLNEELDKALTTGDPLPLQWRFPINCAGGEWTWRS